MGSWEIMPHYREVLTLNVGCCQWSSRKGTDLFGTFHKEELVLTGDIHRKISKSWPAIGGTLWLEVGVPLVRSRNVN